MKIEEWNAIEKDSETDAIAIDGDLCTEIDGIAFLVQRKNDYNNIVCYRVKKSTQSLLKTFFAFRSFLEENHIQFIRVEGGHSHTYNILKIMQRTAPSSCGLIHHDEQSRELNRVVYYVKTY